MSIIYKGKKLTLIKEGKTYFVISKKGKTRKFKTLSRAYKMVMRRKG